MTKGHPVRKGANGYKRRAHSGKRTPGQFVSRVRVWTVLVKDKPSVYSTTNCKAFLVFRLCSSPLVVLLWCLWWCAARIEFAERRSSLNLFHIVGKAWKNERRSLPSSLRRFEFTVNLFLWGNCYLLRNAYVANLCDNDKNLGKGHDRVCDHTTKENR